MALAPAGMLPFGFNSNPAGSGGGSLNLRWVAGVCGQSGGPVAGQTTWIPDGGVLQGATSAYVSIVNNSPEMNVLNSPYNNFSLDNVAGSIDRAPNQWATGDTIILFYTPAS